MLGIGATELFVIAAIALMLFSPRELPNILRSVMKFWGSIKRTADDFKDAIMQEEAMQELRDAYKGGKEVVRKAQGKLAKATKLRDDDGGPAAARPARAATPSSDPRSTAAPGGEPVEATGTEPATQAANEPDADASNAPPPAPESGASAKEASA